MDFSSLALYFAAWFLVALTPGPAVVYAMTQATRHGFRPALVGILGVQLGHLVFFGCVAGGLATALAAASSAFTTLRLIGAAYLGYLGLRVFLATFQSRPLETSAVTMTPTRRRLLLQGAAIQITNPKALLFMSALLPQFIRPQFALATQLPALLAITLAVDVLVLGAYAYFAARGAQSLRRSGMTAWLERALGAVLVFCGIRLVAARR